MTADFYVTNLGMPCIKRNVRLMNVLAADGLHLSWPAHSRGMILTWAPNKWGIRHGLD